MPSRPVYTAAVSGVPVYFDEGSFSIVESLNGTAKLTGTIRSEDGTYRPPADAEVIATENGVRIFGGLIVEPYETGLGDIGNVPIKTAIDATDFSTYAALANVDATFPEQSLKAMLQQLVPFIGNGVTLDPAQATGPTIKGFIGDNRTALDLLNVLAAEAQWIWEIDYNKVLRMYPPGANPSPFNIAMGDGFVEGDIQVWRPGGAARPNRVVLVAGGTPKLIEHPNQNFIGDGTTNLWTLDFPIAGWLPGSVNGVPTGGAVGYGYVVVGGISESIGAPTAGGVIWHYDDATHTITRTLGPVGSGVLIHVPYQYQVPFTVIAEDAADIAIRGVRAVRITADTTYDLATAQTLANNYLAQYQAATNPKRVRYRTKQLGLRIGMHQTINIPIRGLNGVFTVVNIETTVTADNSQGYDVQRIITLVEGLLFRGSPTTNVGSTPLAAGGASGCPCCPAPPQYSAQYENNGICGGAYHILYGPLFWSEPDAFLGEVKTSGWVFVAGNAGPILHNGLPYTRDSIGPSSFKGLTDPNRLEMGMIGGLDFSFDLFGENITGAIPTDGSRTGITGSLGSILMNAPADIFFTAGTGIGSHSDIPGGLRFTGKGKNGTPGDTGPTPQATWDLNYEPAGITLLPGLVGESFNKISGLTLLDGLVGLYSRVTSLPYTINTTAISNSFEFLTFFVDAGTGTINLPDTAAIAPSNLRVFPLTSRGRLFFIKNVSAGVVTVQPFSGNIDGHANITLNPMASVLLQRFDAVIHGDSWHILSSTGSGSFGGSGTTVVPGGPVKAVQFHNPSGFFDGDSQFTWDTVKGQLELTHIQSYSLLKLVNPFATNYGPIAMDIGGNSNNIYFGGELSGGTYLAGAPSPGYIWHQGGPSPLTGSSFIGMGFEQETDEVPGSAITYAKGVGFDIAVHAPSGWLAGEGGYAEIYSYGYGSSGRGAGLHIYRNTDGPSGAPGYLGLQDRSAVGSGLGVGKFWYLWPDISGNPHWGTEPPQADGTPPDTGGIILGAAGTGGTPPFVGLTADPGAPSEDTWWTVRSGVTPNATISIKYRYNGVTHTLTTFGPV